MCVGYFFCSGFGNKSFLRDYRLSAKEPAIERLILLGMAGQGRGGQAGIRG